MLRMASEQESRLLARIGLALLLIVAAGITVAIADPWGRPPDARTALTVDTPFVGQGVAGGTPVLLNGVRVGAVDTVASRTEGGVRLELRLDRESTAGLTDTVGVDFRPSNYFGVTGVNLIHGPPGGQALRDGMRVALVPRGNYTMQALLSRMADFTGGVITEELVRVLQRATQFADALNPMIETMLVVANSVLKAQTVSAGQFVRNTAAIGVVAPAFVDGLTDLACHQQTLGRVDVPQLVSILEGLGLFRVEARRCRRSSALRYQVVLRRIDSDPVKPRVKGTVSAERTQRPVGLDEGLLRNVLDFGGIADQTRQQTIQLALVLGYQQAECLLVAALYALDELLIELTIAHVISSSGYSEYEASGL